MRPFKADWVFIDQVEAELQKQFKRYLYAPIKKIFQRKEIISNANPKDREFLERPSIEEKYRRIEAEVTPKYPDTSTDLKAALRSGRIQYWANKFTGRFDAKVSKDIRNLGGQWRDSEGGHFYLPLANIPQHVAKVITEVNHDFTVRLEEAEKELRGVDGLKVAAAFIATGLFLEALERSEKDFEETMAETDKDAGDLPPPPKATPPKKAEEKQIEKREEELAEEAPRKKTLDEIAEIWENNMKWNIQEWSEDEVKNLRKNLKGLIFQMKNFDKKNKPKDMDKYILEHYGAKISETIYPGIQMKNLTKAELIKIENKASFLARNEFGLFMTTYKYERSKESGCDYFRWVTEGDDRVRPSHKPFNGNIYNFDDPPYDTQLKRAVLPQEAYNCRCEAIPIKESQLKLDGSGKPLRKSDGSYIMA